MRPRSDTHTRLLTKFRGDWKEVTLTRKSFQPSPSGYLKKNALEILNG
jgi:hypothetical protein